MFKLSQAQIDRLIEDRRTIHQNPELGFEEQDTSAYVKQRLQDLGLSVKTVAKTGVITCIDTDKPGKTVLLRADMDCLPIQEETAVSFASKNPGKMHACGHDCHTAILISVAEQLVNHREQLAGRIVLLFQPAEEGLGGAKAVLETGVIDEYQPDCSGGLHIWSQSPTGTALVTDGPFMASGDTFSVTVTGKGGHGAMPHTSNDPIPVAAEMVLALQTICSRRIDPTETVVVTVGTINGGDQFNVIPNKVTLTGTTRTFSKAVQQQVPQLMDTLLKNIAAAHDVSVEIEFHEIAAPTVNDPYYNQFMRNAVNEIDGLTLAEPGFQTMGSEDMCYILEKAKGSYIFLGAGNESIDATYPHHHPCFKIDEAALPYGVELLCRYAEQCCKDNK